MEEFFIHMNVVATTVFELALPLTAAVTCFFALSLLLGRGQ